MVPFDPVDNLTLFQLFLVDPLTGVPEGGGSWRTAGLQTVHRSSFFTVPQYSPEHHYSEAKREKLVHPIFHTWLASPLCPAVLQRGIIAAEKNPGHSGGIIAAVRLTPTPSFSLSFSLAPSVWGPSWFSLHPSIHKSLPLFYWLHGTWQVLIFSVASLLENPWFFCETENAKFFAGDLVKVQKWQARRVLF